MPFKATKPPAGRQPRQPASTPQQKAAPPVFTPAVVQRTTAAPPYRPVPVPQAAPPVYRPVAVQRLVANQLPAPAILPQSSALILRPPQPPPAIARPVARIPTQANGSVINLMAQSGVNALTTNLGYDYTEAAALLHADESDELDALWSANYRVTANTSKAQKRLRATAAAATVRTRLDAILGAPKVTYSANFRTNHLSDADVERGTAKARGEARQPIPPHNTVLKESFLRGLLLTDAGGKADGTYWLRFQSPHPAGGKVSLATRDGGVMRAEDPGLYFVAVRYTLTTTAGARRPKTIHAFHMETDDD
jgi:hypothetical protein